jgi:hypothetical protein
MALQHVTYPSSVTVVQDDTDPQVANALTINSNLLAAQTTLQTWIAANPSGAILTAGQTLVLAKMLNGLCKLLLQQYGSTSGT